MCCFQPPSLWRFVTATMGNRYRVHKDWPRPARGAGACPCLLATSPPSAPEVLGTGWGLSELTLEVHPRRLGSREGRGPGLASLWRFPGREALAERGPLPSHPTLPCSRRSGGARAWSGASDSAPPGDEDTQLGLGDRGAGGGVTSTSLDPFTLQPWGRPTLDQTPCTASLLPPHAGGAEAGMDLRLELKTKRLPD